MAKRLALYASGSNAKGQLATGDEQDAHAFVACRFATSSKGKEDEDRDRETDPSGTALPPRTRAVLRVAGGANHTLVLLARRRSARHFGIIDEAGATQDSSASAAYEHELWGSGDGARGQLGPLWSSVSTTTSREEASVFRRVQLPSFMFGERWEGGRKEGTEEGEMRVVDVAAAWETSYVVLSPSPSSSSSSDGARVSDVVLAMGADDKGALGTGTGTGIGGRGAPQGKGKGRAWHVVDIARAIGCDRFTVLKIAAGPRHVVVLVRATMPDGGVADKVVGWGVGRHGQLGELSVRDAATSLGPRVINLGGGGGGDCEEGGGDPVVDVALGNQHSAFLRASGRVCVVGSNKAGQSDAKLGGIEGVRAVGCTWHGTYVVGSEDAIWSTGKSDKGQLGRSRLSGESPLGKVELPLGEFMVKQMTCGSEHVLALLSSSSTRGEAVEEEEEGEVWGWGWNEHGNLGTGDTEDELRPICVWSSERAAGREDGTYGRPVSVWAGCGTSFVVVESLITE